MYGTITSSDTGRIWLDRNIGASRVCTSFSDKECFGDYFQWGRDADGHEKMSNYHTESTLASTLSPSTNKFIISPSSPYDWTTADSNGSLRSAKWSKIDGTSICPIGYRVPTRIELYEDTAANNKFLGIPFAGYRSYSDGTASVIVDKYKKYLWTSTPSSNYAYWFYNNIFLLVKRAYGVPVRCIKD